MKDIGNLLRNDFNLIITDLYISKQFAAQEISDYLFEHTGIRITCRAIQQTLRSLGIARSYSDAFHLAIKKCRKTYDHLRKPITSSENRKGINLKLRYQVLRRDKFHCVLCGKSAADGTTILVIDHINPVVKGGNNVIDNLRTLCQACNQGKMLLEEKYA